MAIDGIGKLNTMLPPLISNINSQEDDQNVKSFGDFLMEALNQTNQLQLESEKVSEDFAAGRIDDIHQVMIVAEKADIALQFTMQIRNKILDAYNEIMRMQI